MLFNYLKLTMQMAANERPLAHVLQDLADQLENTQNAINPPSSTPLSHASTTRHPVDAEVARLFRPYTQGGRKSTGRRHLAVPTLSSYTHSFCCLDDKNEALVPTRYGKERLAAAGLGEKRLTFKGSQTNSHDFKEFLLDAFPKLREGGGFELLKISGSTRSRTLTLVSCPNEGYHVKYLKDPQTQIGHATLFIRPLKRNLNLEPICQPESSSQLVGPPQKCVTCGEEFPFSYITSEAANRFREDLLNKYSTLKPLSLTVDLGDSAEDRERSILFFYKMAHVEWASPLKCTLKGDPAIGDGVTRHFFSTIMSKLQHGFDTCFVPGGTHHFDGETEHLIPSTSQFLLESDFFVVAGRMIGHSFLHGGPCLGGLSPAILQVLFDGSPEEATIDFKDCADLDIRETIKLLDGTADLSSEEKHNVNELALSWDMPTVTSENRRWLFDKLLYHAVLGRTSRQVKHLRRGLKETQIWPLLTERKDIIPLLFPRTSQIQCTSQMVLDKIKWPTQDEDEYREVSLEDTCRITGFLRTFIENSSPTLIGKLLQFWVGWNVLPPHLVVEVLESTFPRSSTCFHMLKLPGHYEEYSVFERDILAAIWTVDTGFGMV